MSDAAVTTIVTGFVTIVTMVIAFLTLWVKVRYGVGRVEEIVTKTRAVENKIDHNTTMTAQIKDAAEKAASHVVLTNGYRESISRAIAQHDTRLTGLESQMVELKANISNVSKNLDSTRNEMRGHLQAITAKLDLAATKQP